MIEEKLRNFIISELRWNGPQEELSNDYPLIERRVVDSLGLFRMVLFVEGEFGVQIRDEELVAEHFGTIERIASLIRSKQAA